jgi:NADPH-dependent methylglyoxal reductase
VTAYCASKALAERAMWLFVADEKPPFGLVAITPPWIFGPYATELTSTRGLSESVGLLWHMIGAADVLPFDFGGYADVREVAEAHVLALEVPEAGPQRFWVGQGFQYQSAVDSGRELPELKVRLPVGKSGYVDPDVYKVDRSKATRVLGLKYGTLADMVKDTYLQLLHAEQFGKDADAVPLF